MQTRRVWMITLCWSGVTALSVAHAGESQKAATVSASVRELTVSPQAVERPLLKYRLMPAEHQLRDGNAAPILLRLPWDQTLYMTKVVPTFLEYLDLPLDDPKVLDSGKVFSSRFYHELRRAAYRRTAKWEYPIGEEPIANILLPDVQGAREIVARGLSVWIRYHIAHGKLDEAREGILVGLATSRHYGRTPFVITQLACTAWDSMMLSRLEELVSAPGCPNMYWALTALPRPLIDLRPSIELEQRFLQMSVPGLDNLDALQTEDQWTQRVQAVIRHLLWPAKDEGKQILKRLVKRARAELPGWIEGGADRVKAMSDSEAALRWLLHAHNEQSHETAALMSLEPQAAIPRLTALQKRLADFRSQLGGPATQVLGMPLKTYVTTRGIQRRIDALRVVEAIRHYAATHDSQLPESLTRIVDTPIPDDPFTGKPFRYEVIEGAAMLSAQGIEVEGKEIKAIRYRITLRR